ncbi:MAG: transcriptional regulator [Actinobacteria bacterium 13_2_20CM_2_71_6]|nr:MAG: transcriptional regulator [Actinobacteria bacterium 13_2_20CM_2_71_6]
MVLLRRVIGDALRSRRQSQHRTLREVSTAANVSLGYLSEIERGQKEASSELLAAICDALGARLSELLREVSSTVATAEQVDGILAPVSVPDEAGERGVSTMVDGDVSVTVRQETPLKATLRATRNVRAAGRGRDVLSAA